MPKTKRVPTKREFQFEVTMCSAGGGRCDNDFQSIDGRPDYLCSNCRIGHEAKKMREARKSCLS